MALVCRGSRRAMDQLYICYFARLAAFFQNMAARADLIEELINDTMFDLWEQRDSIGENVCVFVAIMRLAYVRVRKHLAEATSSESDSARAVEDNVSRLQVFLAELPIEERAVAYLAYAGGCSRRETADVLEIGCNSVDVLMSRVQQGVRSHYALRGG
jgi:RNA polymerase sigma-70 factor (ECF subfamily)